MIEAGHIAGSVAACREDEVRPALVEYAGFADLSPGVGPARPTTEYTERALTLLADWARTKLGDWPGAAADIVRLPDCPPLVLVDVPGQAEGDVLLYGRLVGPRGGAGEGQAMFDALAAIAALREQGVAHARCTLLIDAGSDVPICIDRLADRLGEPSLVICLDPHFGTGDRLWLATSLPGVVEATLSVRVVEPGVHSGEVSGPVASSFHLVSLLLARLEDPHTGRIRPSGLHADVPARFVAEARALAEALGPGHVEGIAAAERIRATSDDPAEPILDRTWRPQLTVAGLDGWRSIIAEGGVSPPTLSVGLGLSLPPTLDADDAAAAIKMLLEADPPHGAVVEVALGRRASGWTAPRRPRWLDRSIAAASQLAFGAPPVLAGRGGSIPLVARLARRYRRAQFVMMGGLGPRSDARDPNELRHRPAGRRVPVAVARLLADHAEAQQQMSLSGWDVARY